MRLVLAQVLFSFLVCYNEVIASEAAPSNCHRLTTINYHYSSSYHLPDMDANKTDSDVTFEFSVRAVSDGHLRLSSTPDAKQSAVTIEVVLGAGGNTFSAVRRRPKTGIDYTVNTDRILSDKELRPFSLVLKGKTLALYANHSDLPLLFYEDPSVPDMLYISFGAWNNVAVEWSFDCRGAEVPEPPINDPLKKLRRTYWAQYDPFNPPVLDNSTLEVSISIAVIHVHLNALTSQFTLRGKFDIEWTDQKLQWNPEEYGNITHLNFKYRVIWMPAFELLDVPKVDTSILEGRTVRLYHSGAAKYRSMGEVETWCDMDVSDWPSDEHVCDLHIGLRFHPEAVRVILTGTGLELETSGLEWDIISITEVVEVETGEAPQSFKLRIRLKRIPSSYVLLFVVPLLVSFSMLVTSFVISPQHKSRLVLVSASILCLNLLLIGEDLLLPTLPQSTPRIIKTTSCLWTIAVFQLIFHCFNIHVASFEMPAPTIVKAVAKKPWMKHLHQATYEIFTSEDKQDLASDQSQPLHDERREQSDGVDVNKYHWTLVSRALDMLSIVLSFFILPFLMVPI